MITRRSLFALAAMGAAYFIYSYAQNRVEEVAQEHFKNDFDRMLYIDEPRNISPINESRGLKEEVRPEYRSLLLTSKKLEGVRWIDTLLHGLGYVKGQSVTITRLASEILEVDAAPAAYPRATQEIVANIVDRFGRSKLKSNLINYFKGHFNGCESLTFPVIGKPNISTDPFDLKEWSKKVERLFDPQKGWKEGLGIVQLTERGIAIYCADIAGEPGAVKRVKELAGAVVHHYLTCELPSKYQDE